MSRMTPAEAEQARGCWLEGSRGWTASYVLIDIAAGYGFPMDADDHTLLAAYKASAERVTLASGEDVDVAECVIGQGEMAERAEEWLNDHVAPEGWAFGWHDGEFFLWPDAEWPED